LSGLAQTRGNDSGADGILALVGGIMLTKVSGKRQPAGVWVVLFDRGGSPSGEVSLNSNTG